VLRKSVQYQSMLQPRSALMKFETRKSSQELEKFKNTTHSNDKLSLRQILQDETRVKSRKSLTDTANSLVRPSVSKMISNRRDNDPKRMVKAKKRLLNLLDN